MVIFSGELSWVDLSKYLHSLKKKRRKVVPV